MVTPEQAAETLGHVFRFFKYGPSEVTPFQSSTDPFARTDGTEAPPAATSMTDIQMSSPIGDTFPVTGAFGENREGHIHGGVDLGTPEGTPLIAAINGTVTQAGLNDPNGYGNLVEITGSDGIKVIYGHLSKVGVSVGDTIHEGMVIGYSGGAAGAPGSGNSTGPHLHFEVRRSGTVIDPTPYIKGAVGEGSTQVNTASTTTTPAPEAGTITADKPAEALKTTANSLINGPSADLTVPSTAEQRAKVIANSAASAGTVPNNSTPNSKFGGDADPNAVDAFLNAIKTHESGGDYSIRNTSGLSNAAGAYQFIGTTWRGLGGSTQSAADASPAEQDRIAKAYAMQLFDQFHSWRLAAIAWYGGPGIAEKASRGIDPGAPEGQGRYLDYGYYIASMMGN